MRLKKIGRLPDSWAGLGRAEGLLVESSIRIGRSKLRAKVLIFDRPASLLGFWKYTMNDTLEKGCLGVVQGLKIHKEEITRTGTTRQWIEADEKYYCVIGLCATHLGMEIICHESVHAAYAYIKRVKRSPWDQQIKRFDEEEVAYPAGAIARELNRLLYRCNLYEIGERLKKP